MTTRARLSAFPGYAVERSAGEHAGIELLICRTVRYRRQPDGRSFRRAQAVVARTPDARAAVNAEIALLATCAGPGLPRLLETADGAYVTPLLSSDTLEERGAADDLGDADLRRVSACLRSAVLALHDAGRAHGRLGAAAVRFTDDGEPALTGLRETAPLTAGGRQRDLRALDALRARLGTEAEESAGPALEFPAGAGTSSGTGDEGDTAADGSADLASDTAADGSGNGDPAATVLRELAHRRAARRPDLAESGPPRNGPAVRQRRRLVVSVAGGAAALGALTAAGFALATVTDPSLPAEQVSESARGDRSSGTVDEDVGADGPAGTAQPPRTAAPAGVEAPGGALAPEDAAGADPVGVLQDLVDARTAWITGNAASDTANAPGSPAMSTDFELRSAWEGAEVSDWRVRVLDATTVEGDLIAEAGGADVVLDARMQDLAGTATWPDGSEVDIPGSGVYSARVTLQSVAGDWRIDEVARR